MKYDKIIEASFQSRPNRFLAKVLIDGKEDIAHVKNTGRCKELLIPGVKVFLQEHDNPNRKTKYSLIGVMKDKILVNLDSQAPNRVVGEWLNAGGIFKSPDLVKPEKTYGNSRFDFYIEKGNQKAFVEVKGVTLEEDGIARFPDAPTERGKKHVEELCKCIKEGYEAYVIFVIQMKGIRQFEPNDKTHQEFGDTLRKAKDAGVHIMALDCIVTENQLIIDQEVPVIL